MSDLSPYAVKEIDWSEERINVNVTRDQVKSSPAWDPLAMTDNRSASSTSTATSGGLATAGEAARKKERCLANGSRRVRLPNQPTHSVNSTRFGSTAIAIGWDLTPSEIASLEGGT
jgi:hypothetical protein